MTINTWSGVADVDKVDDLSRRKLEVFARIEDDFIASFSFTQEAHGQRRFTSFPIASTVRYLRALYICECKDRLLSVLKNIERYEGERCLELLRGWQKGHTADVVAFIHRKLDNQPFGEVTRQLEEAERMGDLPRVRRLTSGRMVLLNRNFNLSQALDAIFTPTPERLLAEVRAACAQAGQTPEDIERELVELRSDVFAYAPSPSLARRNMLLMNSLGHQILDERGEPPETRTDRVGPHALPVPAYAEELIRGEWTQTSLRWIGRAALDAVVPPPASDQTSELPAADA